MMRFPILKLVVVTGLFSLVPLFLLAQGERENLKKEIEKIIYNDTNITDGPVKNLVVSVIDGDSIFTVGINLPSATDTTDIEALYELGSVSKSLTTALFYTLEEQDFLALSDPINQYLPKKYQNPRCDEVTIADLIHHHSPFPRRPSYFGKISKTLTDPYADYGRKHLLEFYRDFIPKKNLPSFSYSHTNFALLEIITEIATGYSFSEACNNFLFNPLGMNRTITGNQENLPMQLADGYDRAGRSADHWYLQSFVASEGIRSNAADLAKYLQAQMFLNNPIIDPILQDMQTVIGPTNLGKDLYITNGWFNINRKKKYNILTMSGHTTGHRAELSFIPETKTGVVLLSNCNSGAEDLSILILRMINDNWKRKI